MLSVVAACLAIPANAQLAASAYRVFGQVNLSQNSVNIPSGVEFATPAAVALDTGSNPVHLYVLDALNNRVLAWNDANQTNGPADLILGQPNAFSTLNVSLGVKTMLTPLAIAVQPGTGNVFVSDTSNHRVLRFPSPFANPTRVEPDAVYGQSSFTGHAANTGGVSGRTMNAPRGLAFDASGNLWVSDSGNDRVLRFLAASLDPLASANPSADIVLGQKDLATTGNNGGAGVSASGFDSPVGVAVDATGRLWVSDQNNSRVLVFPAPQTTNQAASLVLGQTRFTSKGVPAQTTGSVLGAPGGLALDATGNVFITDSAYNRVLVFDPPAQSGPAAKTALGQPNLTSTVANVGTAPKASAAGMSVPTDIKVAADGSVFVVDSGNNRVLVFAKDSPTPNRVIGQTNFTVNGRNRVGARGMYFPYRAAADYSQSSVALYVSDTGNNRVLGWKSIVNYRSGAPADLVIGQPDLISSWVNYDSSVGKPSSRSLNTPRGLVVDSAGNLYVADSGNNRVLLFPKPFSQSGPVTASTVLGQPDMSSNSASSVLASSMNTPSGITLGANGDLFVADTGNNRVLQFSPGNPSTASRVFGQNDFFSNFKPSIATSTVLSRPQGVAVDALGNLYVADTGLSRIVIFANVGTAPVSGAPALVVLGQDSFQSSLTGTSDKRMKNPSDVAVDSAGVIYVSDSGNNRVMVFPSLTFLSPSNSSATGVFGQPNLTTSTPNWNSSSGAGTPEALWAPSGLFVDRRDTLFVADSSNNRVLHVLKFLNLLNGATYVESAPVARGSVAVVKGSGLATGDAILVTDATWPTTVNNRSLVFNETVLAPMFYVSGTQFNFQVPFETAIGQNLAAIRVSDTGELLAGGSYQVVDLSPGFLTATGDGKGPGLILNEDNTINGVTRPATKGTVIALFGTGQGPVNPPVGTGQAGGFGDQISKSPLQYTTDPPTCLSTAAICVAIGSGWGEVLYSGLAPGLIGVWQVNVRIPANAPSGSVGLRAVVNSIPTNLINVYVR
jgi:uncharacterized protein (TIGR03437 family)